MPASPNTTLGLALYGESLSNANRHWLDRYHASYPPHEPDNDLATTFLCCGAIVLTATVLGFRARKLVAEFTGLPVGFVQTACDAMDLAELWDSRYMHDVNEGLMVDDFPEIEASLSSVMKDLSDNAWNSTLAMELQVLRDGKLVGG
ncbi:MAG TPA: hypothetical protein VN682_19880 [Terriglobales bacterium]|nr:hypothetical protein [Terriglobales bacterium]